MAKRLSRRNFRRKRQHIEEWDIRTKTFLTHMLGDRKCALKERNVLYEKGYESFAVENYNKAPAGDKSVDYSRTKTSHAHIR